jgi:acyl phosphate:glycerol-3-phosphate acyltransferase
MMSWMSYVVAAYLVGAVPFAYLIGRAKGIDIRRHGSKNVGATNLGRALGRRLGILCFALDAAKGAAPVIAAGVHHGLFGAHAAELSPAQMWWWLAVAAAAVIGHMFPIFLGFRGGKGVSTAFGAIVAMWPLFTLPSLAALLVWGVIVSTTRYMSLASMLAAATLPAWFALNLVLFKGPDDSALDAIRHGAPGLVVTAALAAAVVVRHRTNLARLLSGSEMKVGGGAGAKPGA